MTMSHPIKHFVTITRHRHRVIAHCAKAGILWRGLLHDLSKYSPHEFIVGARFYTGNKSPNEGERADKGYSAAWMHHKGRNKHHFEYWTDYDPKRGGVWPVKMPLVYVVEMFCDRVAADKIYNGKNYSQAHPLEYFERGKGVRAIHPETSQLLEKLLRMLKDEGEDATFEYIRKTLLKEKEY